MKAALAPALTLRGDCLSRILRYAPEGEYTLSWVLNEVSERRMMVYDILQGDKRIGQALLQGATSGVRRVLYVFGIAAQGRRWHADVAEALRSLARSLGCEVIRGRSPRGGWARFAHPVATEYELEVQA